MSPNHDEQNIIIKKLEKEILILKKKMERCNKDRGDLESLFNQTRKLLETASAEKLSEEEQKQLSLFRKFVPHEFLQNLDKANWFDVKLGDHVERDMIILFNDIRSFTSMSEKLTCEENFKFINDYFYYIYPSIQENHGFVDKYIGDAIMALFLNSDDAINAGISMHKGLQTYNKEREKRGEQPIESGIGLHKGNVMLGIIGVEDRLQGTVISKVVNLASRLEALTKLYKSCLIVSEFVLGENKNAYPTRFLGKVRVIGEKAEGMKIFEILSAENEDIFEKKLASKPFFETGLNLYFNKEFPEASVQFKLALKNYMEDKAANLYLKKCAANMVADIEPDWDGAELV